MKDIPQPLKTIVTKSQEKVYVLNLEKELITFIKESILSKTESPLYIIHAGGLKNSYYRLLSHQICQYYHLQHWNSASNDIIVTLSADGFDYEKFTEVLELKNDKTFVKISDYVQQRHGSTNGHISESEESTTRIIKPRIIKKDSPKSNSVVATVKLIQETTQMSDHQHKSKINEKTSNLDKSNALKQNLADGLNSGSDDIEVERASKEALYMKVREKIFQDQQDDDENQEDYGEQTEEEKSDYYFDNGEVNDNDEEEDEDEEVESDNTTPKSSTSDIKPGNINKEKVQKHNGNFRSDYSSFQSTEAPQHIPPVPIGMPLNYNVHMHIPQFINPNGYYNSPNQSIYPPQISPYNQYSNYFPASPPMMSFQNGFYSNAYNGGHNYIPYDKETERKLLNNPYIIIPDSTRDKKHKKPYKTRQANGHANGNTNSTSRMSNLPPKNSTNL